MLVEDCVVGRQVRFELGGIALALVGDDVDTLAELHIGILCEFVALHQWGLEAVCLRSILGHHHHQIDAMFGHHRFVRCGLLLDGLRATAGSKQDSTPHEGECYQCIFSIFQTSHSELEICFDYLKRTVVEVPAAKPHLTV